MPHYLRLIFFLLPLLTAFEAKADLEYDWVEVVPSSGVFIADMPSVVKVKEQKVRISPSLVVYKEEAVATLDQRPLKNAVKNYIVRFEQTLGPALTPQQKENLIFQELQNYIEFYKDKNVALKEEKDLDDRGYFKEFFLTYEDPSLGLQGLRARVNVSDETVLQQVFIGPEPIMYGHLAQKFFNSLNLTPGFSINRQPIEDAWPEATSPLEIFSYRMPPLAAPYIPQEPVVSHTDNSESVKFVAIDPVRKERIFYNLYGYDAGRNLTFSEVENILMGRHVSNHRRSLQGVDFRRIHGGTWPAIEVVYKLPRHKKFPFLEQAKLRAVFMRNYVFVQEILASDVMMNSVFLNTLKEQIEFHPKRAFAAKNAAQDTKADSSAP